MPGAAIVEAEIDGVLHEYSTMEVQEDVVDLLLNLKDLALVLDDKDEVDVLLIRRGLVLLLHLISSLTLMCAQLIQIVIAHLEDKAHLKARLKIQR